MKRVKVLLLGVAVSLTLLVGFALGRDRIVVRPGIVNTPYGSAFKLAWSGTSSDTGRPIFGRLVWRPGFFTPRVLENVSQSDCLPDQTIDELLDR